MQCLGWLAIALCALQVNSLPVASEMSADDTKVMKCVVEVISDTLSKPNALPISPECLQTLRGDERIISILRHQNLLKELQELAVKGANEKVRTQKKSSSFAEELSKVLENPDDKSNNRDTSKETSSEDSAASSTEARGDKSKKDSERNASEEGRNSWEQREPSEHEPTPEEEAEDNEAGEPLERNEIGDPEEALGDDIVDNHVMNAVEAEELSERKQQEHEAQPGEATESRELQEEKEHVTEKHLEGKQEEDADDHEEERRASERENPEESNTKGSQEEEEDNTQRKNGNQDDAVDDKSHEDIGEIHHHLENDMMREDEASRPKESRSEEQSESSSKEVLDSKRWNKMDELAKELTSKKRMAESEEDPDRSMKIPFRAHKYDFNSQEREVRRSWLHPSSKDSGERGLEIAIRPSPEEKKEEEGSANRRTEDQELESLTAIEAELEKVAHKLHELRRG